jgi:hypothetical protein
MKRISRIGKDVTTIDDEWSNTDIFLEMKDKVYVKEICGTWINTKEKSFDVVIKEIKENGLINYIL